MTTRSLHLAKDLTIPLLANPETQTFAVLAKRGVGKTYTAAVFAEELLKAERQVVVIDPIGVWHGLRSSADGKHPGLPIIVMGGEHGDVPLEVTAGATVADFIVEHRASVVLDLSKFRKGEQLRFMTDFAETLYHKNRQPVMVIVDEADAFAPQRPQPGEQRLLGAMEDLVRRGRARGIGLMLVTQRAAVLNKNVLTQIEVLVVLRTIAPQDRDAIDAWVKVYGTNEQREQLMASLPSLAIGEAWIWSPGWLELFQRIHVRQRETFDSSATPKAGDKIAAPKERAAVDLDALKTRIAATIEKAKADDPRELRNQIAALKKQLSSTPVNLPTERKATSTPVLTDADRALLEKVQKRLDNIGAALLDGTTVIADHLAAFVRDETQKALAGIEAKHATARERYVALLESKGIQKILGKLATVQPERLAVATTRQTDRHTVVEQAPRSVSRPPRQPATGLDGAQQKILDVVAMLGVRGIDVNRESVARWLDIHPNGGRYGSNLAHLRAEGYLDGFTLTEKGTAAAASMATGLAAACEPLDGAQRLIVETLDQYAQIRFTRERLAAELGIHPNGGRYGSNLARLRTMGLIPDRGDIYLTEGARR